MPSCFRYKARSTFDLNSFLCRFLENIGSKLTICSFSIFQIIENKPFLLRDSHLPVMTDDGNFLKKVDDDDFSTDSWDQISNEELGDIVEITKGIMSPPASPSDLSIKSEPLSGDDHFEYKDDLGMDSPPVLVSGKLHFLSNLESSLFCFQSSVNFY